jgi:hypothetical protein
VVWASSVAEPQRRKANASEKILRDMIVASIDPTRPTIEVVGRV